MKEKIYIAIDLKSFYASVECVERGWDPFTTRLVVADPTRTDKTICLAVSPALKACGVPGRPRLFEVQQIAARKQIDFEIAPPRMALYMEYSTRIYDIYLKYISAEDMHIYSVDEVFLEVSSYLGVYRMTVEELTRVILKDIFDTTGITATAGIGSNLYLSKVAMDIVAKHAQADENGARMARLDEMSYRRLLWDHMPITDFWRVGPGYAKKLASVGIVTMGQVAKCSVGDAKEFYNEKLLYSMFGVNAELLIDHAWGYEPVTIADIHAYVPDTKSISQGQVLQEPYAFADAELIVKEMADQLILDLVEKRFVTDQIVLDIGYDVENILDPAHASDYHGEIVKDRYGRKLPKPAHGSENLQGYTSSDRRIMDAAVRLFERITDPHLLVRRVQIAAVHLLPENKAGAQGDVFSGESFHQMTLEELFADKADAPKETFDEEKERKLQEAVLNVKNRYGKNAILRGMNLEEKATARDRNRQIGGHKA